MPKHYKDVTDEEKELIISLYKRNVANKQIINITGLSKYNLYKILKEKGIEKNAIFLLRKKNKKNKKKKKKRCEKFLKLYKKKKKKKNMIR